MALALLERFTGAPGWHAVCAGAIAVTALLAGGARRLLGPLVLGTVTLVTLAVYESLGVTAHVPTWAWPAAAGVLPLAAGIAMERAGARPADLGRRLGRAVRTRYN